MKAKKVAAKRGKPSRADILERLQEGVTALSLAVLDRKNLYEAREHAGAIVMNLAALRLPADRRNGTPDRRGGR